jgi:predicted HTH transcriptional regulator
LDAVVSAGEKENVSLDYKDSRSLDFSDKTPMKDKRPLGDRHREDIIRDVAAMANAEGGTIIHGVAERTGGFPDKIDDGTDLKVTSADRIEQILTTNIHPRVEGLFIRQIELKSKGKGTYAFAISIPKATTNAPHQADNKIYYKRHDATKLPMDDHEIRDMVGRSLEFGRKFGMTQMGTHSTIFSPPNQEREPPWAYRSGGS